MPLIYPDPDAHILPEHNVSWAKDERDREKCLAITIPKKYKGESFESLRNWKNAWEEIFEARPYSYNTHANRVRVAAANMEGDPSTHWGDAKQTMSRPEGIPLVWNHFIEFLKGLHASKETRSAEVTKNIKRFRQQQGESVQAMCRRFITLIEDRNSRMTDEDIITNLREAITHAATAAQIDSYAFANPPRTFQQWKKLASDAESSVKRTQGVNPHSPKAGNSGNGGGQGGNNAGGSHKRHREEQSGHSNKKRATSGAPSNSSRPKHGNGNGGKSSKGNTTCHSCGQEGHWSGDRKCPKFAKWAQDNPQAAEAKERFETAKKNLQNERKVYAAMRSGEQKPSSSGKDAGKGNTKS
jgi:hypothetical protein